MNITKLIKRESNKTEKDTRKIFHEKEKLCLGAEKRSEEERDGVFLPFEDIK